MTPKLLQKKSNRFLQLALPENLIANKRIGKREKYNHRPGAAANNLRGMEKRILGQWAFSWNMYKKRMVPSVQSKKGMAHMLCKGAEGTMLRKGKPENMEKTAQLPQGGWQPLPFPRARFTTLPPCAAHPCFLVTPSLYILQDRISRALGGNVIQYLKESNAMSGMPILMPSPLGRPFPLEKAKAKEKNLFRFPAEKTGLEYPVSDFSNRCAQHMWNPPALSQRDHRVFFSGKKGVFERLPLCPNLISDAPVHFGHKKGEMLIEHCRKNHFNMIYSLLAGQILQSKARGDRRDRIADHYRNQLAEWRKIAFLYGGLGLKAALRLHRQAHLLGGDVDSNFLSLLECRLDVTLKRAFFFSTLKAARQWIQRGKIYVNNQRCTLAGALLQPADLITISPSATMEWRKSRLQTFSLMTEKGAFQFSWSPLNWNRVQQPNQISHRVGLPLANEWNGADRAGWGMKKGGATPAMPLPFPFPEGMGMVMQSNPRGMALRRRFPFSPALMRKWKEWSEIWGNSRYSFLERHNWPTNAIGEQHFLNPRFAFPEGNGIPLNDRFTGKGSQRFAFPGGNGIVFSTQSFYSSSCLTNYLSATNSSWNNAISNPQTNLKESFARQSLTKTYAALDFSLLQRRQTSITSFICGLPMTVPRPKQHLNHKGLHQVGPGKFAGQGVRRDKSGRAALLQKTTRAEHALRTPLRIRLGQVIGGERKKRCQWLHQRQSNVVDGLYALRWNKGFARKKLQGEKKNQWRWSCIKPLHLECSYKLGTVIFLFFPQKLAWPSSINVSLLRKKLGG